MLRSKFRLDYSAAVQDLLPKLRGKAFHVSCRSNLDAIFAAGAIDANADGRLRGGFGYYDSFFRRMKCVSVFDYRTASDEQIQDSLDNCAPWQAGHACGHRLAIFVLSARASGALIPGPGIDSLPNAAMVVAYVEAGYPGSIRVADLDEIMEVCFDWNPSPHIAALERWQPRRGDDTGGP